ncbi:50S ribosomal protein L10 [Aliifodinibius sp. S!AR15-10]|uniref:50S ribosomal protein L10 n=1 Tax=Aliifodinibius sp. S!AR15-10 TaxID=2950437 RepID=UPI002857C16E|nr:50S ribosomal protein L10 [Aliifodinibius sp. S!AR15-10]MDR8392063.1 50S ribosomal protein L10 [Aliifodinibius sp. S!AR15-10]
MPTLAQKKAVVEEITEDLNNSNALYITNYSGMSVAEINELRSEFYKGDIKYKVYKNTLVKRAMDEVGGYDDLYPHLVEQNGFAFVEEELAAPAKVIKKFKEEHKKPQFKAAIIDGDFYGEDKLETLAAMKSKSEVIGDIVGLLLAPVSNVVSALQAPGKKVAGAVESIAEKGEN